MRLVQTIACVNVKKLQTWKTLFEKLAPSFRCVSLDELTPNSEKIFKLPQQLTSIEHAVAMARIANRGVHYPCLAEETRIVLKDQFFPEPFDQRDLENLRSRLPQSRVDAVEIHCAVALSMEGLLIHAESFLQSTFDWQALESLLKGPLPRLPLPVLFPASASLLEDTFKKLLDSMAQLSIVRP